MWAQLYARLRDGVEAGEFDEAFPSEMTLVAQFGVSRNTVRDALRRLRADGLVVAERGRRPRLASTLGIHQPLGALYSLFHSTTRAGLEARSVVRALELRRSAPAAARLGCRPDDPLVYLERIRLADERPIAIDRAFFVHDLAAPLLEVDFSTRGFYDELAARAGVALTGGEERIRATVPTGDDRVALELDETTAALEIERIGRIRERVVEWRTTVARGDRFVLSAAFSAGGYQIEPGEDATDASA